MHTAGHTVAGACYRPQLTELSRLCGMTEVDEGVLAGLCRGDQENLAYSLVLTSGVASQDGESSTQLWGALADTLQGSPG